jgi:lysophospholipase L1-like esterase
VTVNSGSQMAATFTGTGLSARFDTANYNPPIPNLYWQLDDAGSWQQANVASTVVLAGSLATGTHKILLMVRALDENQNRWTPPLVSVVQFLGFDVTGGGLVPTPRPVRLKMEILGDSITEGVHVHDYASEPPALATPPGVADALLDYASQTAIMLNAEYRQVGFGAQGVTKGGNGNVPRAGDAFAFFFAGVPRDNWQADLVVVNQGTNDDNTGFAQAYADYLNIIRAAYPTAKIAAMVPFNGSHLTDISATVTARSKAGDQNVFLVDTTGWLNMPSDFHPNDTAVDNTHPSVQGHAKAATLLVAELKKHL